MLLDFGRTSKIPCPHPNICAANKRHYFYFLSELTLDNNWNKQLDTLLDRVYILIMTREFIITKEFDNKWKELGLNDNDLMELEIYLCKNPDCRTKSNEGIGNGT